MAGSAPHRSPAVTVVIPAFNEAERLPGSLERVLAYADAGGPVSHVIVVDDGSTDGTADAARGVLGGRGAVLVNEVNRGKGYAVRRGLAAAVTGRPRHSAPPVAAGERVASDAATYAATDAATDVATSDGREPVVDAVLICDADLSTPIEQLDGLVPWLGRGVDVVIGSREMSDSRRDPPQPPARHAAGRLLSVLTQVALLPGVRDTQCGFKLLSAGAAGAVLPAMRVDGFAWDLELLAEARRQGLRVREVGVAWHDDRDSRVSIVRDAPRMLADLARLVWRYRVRPA